MQSGSLRDGQASPDPAFARRTPYYGAKLDSGQIAEGEPHGHLHPSMMVNWIFASGRNMPITRSSRDGNGRLDLG